MTTHYPRAEFRESDPDTAPFRPSWQTAVPAVESTLRGWLERLGDGPFDAVVTDADNRRWHLTARADEGELTWRVEMAGYRWFMSARTGARNV